MSGFSVREKCACGAEFEETTEYGIAFDEIARWRERHAAVCAKLQPPAQRVNFTGLRLEPAP